MHVIIFILLVLKGDDTWEAFTGQLLDESFIFTKRALEGTQIGGNERGHWADHCRWCTCAAVYQTHVLRILSNQPQRKIFEAFRIAKEGGACVSTPSVALSSKEVFFLQGRSQSTLKEWPKISFYVSGRMCCWRAVFTYLVSVVSCVFLSCVPSVSASNMSFNQLA